MLSIRNIYIAILLDKLFKDQKKLHPISIYGRYLSLIENITYKDSYLNSIMYTFLSLLPIFLLKNIKVRYHFFILYYSLGVHSLIKISKLIHSLLLNDNISQSRLELRKLCSRETSNLNKEEIISSVLESLSENYIDSGFASLFYSFIMSDLILLHRMINTMDATVGYKSKRYKKFGYVPAKLDDILNYIPARLGSLLIYLFCNNKKINMVDIKYIISEAKKDSSPNAGYPESTLANIMKIRIGGSYSYSDDIKTNNSTYFGERYYKEGIKSSDIKRGISIIKRSFYRSVILFTIINTLRKL